MTETTWRIVLDDGCTFDLYEHTPGSLDGRVAVGHWHSCHHSKAVSYDPDTGEPRKHERDRQVVRIDKFTEP